MLEAYRTSLSLDVNAVNAKAISFYSGLGLIKKDEYKVLSNCGFIKFETPHANFMIAPRKSLQALADKEDEKIEEKSSPVSYTHLTLPTKRIV